ncbi:MAG: SGNH/GDSL hydrolase family protein [Verrucomicrobia bacterium]|nr:SGNH/GDSL hydrolase family protein [Verrucomicrobiota bacterium]
MGWLAWAAILFSATAHATTNLFYDAGLTPHSLPASPPWVTMGGTGGHQQIAFNKLTLVDTNDNTAGFYYLHKFDASEINSKSDYQVWSKVRVVHYGDLGVEKPLWSAIFDDGTHTIGYGMTLDKDGNTRFFFINWSPATGRYVHTEPGNGFHDVVLTKRGATSGTDDCISLTVNGEPVLTQNGDFMNSTNRDAYFGASTGAAFGTVEVQAVAFGVNQPAAIPGRALPLARPPVTAPVFDFPFKDGDRVVFLGDSITEQRLYTTYIESYLLTRFPGYRFQFRNVGHSGDTAWLRRRDPGVADQTFYEAVLDKQQALVTKMIAQGLNRDVFPLRPTVVLVNLGVNDLEADVPVYRRAMRELVAQLKQANLRVALFTTSPHEYAEGPIAKRWLNFKLDLYADVVKRLAAKEKLPFADQFHRYIEVVDNARTKNPGFRTMPDCIHPMPSGHLIMAWAILKDLHAPAVVSEVTIKLDKNPAQAECAQAKVSDLMLNNGVIAFTCADAALPLPTETSADFSRTDVGKLNAGLPAPLPAEAEAALPYAPILDDLSRHILRVSGAQADRYDLWIDGKKVASLTRAELEKGWNLTAASTPMIAQAKKLMQKVVEKNNVYFHRWQEIQIPALRANKTDDPDVKAKLEQADQQITKLESEIETLRKPQPHKFELKPGENK